MNSMKRPYSRAQEPRIQPAAITYTPVGPYTAPQVVPTSRDDPQPAFIPQPPPKHVWDFAKNKIQENKEEKKLTRVFRNAMQQVAAKNRAPPQSVKDSPSTFMTRVENAAKSYARRQHGLDLNNAMDRKRLVDAQALAGNARPDRDIKFDADGKITQFGRVDMSQPSDSIDQQGKLLAMQSMAGQGYKRGKGKKKVHKCKTPYCICKYNRRKRHGR